MKYYCNPFYWPDLLFIKPKLYFTWLLTVKMIKNWSIAYHDVLVNGIVNFITRRLIILRLSSIDIKYFNNYFYKLSSGVRPSDGHFIRIPHEAVSRQWPSRRFGSDKVEGISWTAIFLFARVRVRPALVLHFISVLWKLKF